MLPVAVNIILVVSTSNDKLRKMYLLGLQKYALFKI